MLKSGTLNRRHIGALAGLLVLAPLVAGCGGDEAPGVFIELRVDNEAFRPEYLLFHWMLPGRASGPMRLPESGNLASSGPVLGTVFFETDGPLLEPRLLAARGYRGNLVVSGTALVVPADPGQRRVNRVAILGPPLTDSDGDGTPDIVENDCLSVNKGAGCVQSQPGGITDAGMAGDAAGDGPTGDAPDAGAPVGDADPSAEVGPSPDAGADANPDASASLAEGLVAYYSFEEGGNATLIIDRTGKGNNGTKRGTVNGVAGPPGLGSAVEIPGQSGNGITVTDSASLETIRTGLTIAAFTHRTADQSGLATVVSRQAMSSTSEHFTLAFSQTAETPPGGATLRALLNTTLGDSGRASVTTAQATPKNRWVHVAVTYDSTFVRLYVDGTLATMAPYTTPIANNDVTGLCIGCGQNDNSGALIEPLGGRLDELALYSRALTEAEIAQLAAGQRPALPL